MGVYKSTVMSEILGKLFSGKQHSVQGRKKQNLEPDKDCFKDSRVP